MTQLALQYVKVLRTSAKYSKCVGKVNFPASIQLQYYIIPSRYIVKLSFPKTTLLSPPPQRKVCFLSVAWMKGLVNENRKTNQTMRFNVLFFFMPFSTQRSEQKALCVFVRGWLSDEASKCFVNWLRSFFFLLMELHAAGMVHCLMSR